MKDKKKALYLYEALEQRLIKYGILLSDMTRHMVSPIEIC